MKFGLLFRPQDPPAGRNIVQRWEETLAAAEIAEAVGFDGVFVPEHHGWVDGYLPQPLVALAAIAARTERVDVGTTVTWLPVRHPVHVAEEAAVVDVISNGRLRMGVGMGSAEDEYKFFGLDAQHRVSKFVEAVDLIERAWRGEELDHNGHYRASGRISPLPVNAQMWLGAMFEPGIRRAARMGYPWMTDPLRDIFMELEMVEWYRSERENSRNPENLGIILLRDGWIGETRADVEREWWPIAQAEFWSYFSAVPSLSHMGESFDDPSTFTFDSHRPNRLIAGSPADCREAVEQCVAEIDPDYLIISMRLAGGPGFDREAEALKLFGAEVIAPYKEG